VSFERASCTKLWALSDLALVLKPSIFLSFTFLLLEAGVKTYYIITCHQWLYNVSFHKTTEQVFHQLQQFRHQNGVMGLSTWYSFNNGISIWQRQLDFYQRRNPSSRPSLSHCTRIAQPLVTLHILLQKTWQQFEWPVLSNGKATES